jgi:lysophospholipase L1-like esterase
VFWLAYWVHLLLVVGALFVLRPWLGSAPACLWFSAGLALAFAIRRKPAARRAAYGWLLCFYSAALTLGAAEGILRLFAAGPPGRASFYSYYTPGTIFVAKVDPRYTPGIVAGCARFTVNEIGLRGPSLKAFPSGPRPSVIIAVGGSTTECPFLDDTTEWPHLLMELLNSSAEARPVLVENAGVNGHTTVEHLALLESMRVLRQADLLLFLTGINDLIATLAFEGRPTEAALEKRAARTAQPIAWRERYAAPAYTHLRLFQLVNAARKRLLPQEVETGEWLQGYRLQRSRGPVLPLPDLTVGLEEYRTRILRLTRRCRELGKRAVFLTQPTMWRGDLSTAEQRLLWFGRVGRLDHPRGFASSGDLARAMELYNQTLLGVCREQGLECYDLAEAIPKGSSSFFDDCHFTEKGAGQVARFLAGKLRDRLPPGHPAAPAELR